MNFYSCWCSYIFLAFILNYSLGQEVPSKIETYRAVGEIVSLNSNGGRSSEQIFFEENYDDLNHRSSLILTSLSLTVRILEFHKLKQTFIYNEDKIHCEPYDTDKWLNQKIAPDLPGLSIKENLAVFPIKQLLSLRDLKSQFVPDSEYRGLSAKKWTYELLENKTKTKVSAFWSNESMTSPSKNGMVPLGFEVDHVNTEDPKKQFTQHISVFLFTHDDVNWEKLMPKRGVYCDGRKEQIPFPNLADFKTLAFEAEHIFEDFLAASSVDAWMDPVNKLCRFDMVPFDSFNLNPEGLTRIVSLEEKLSFDISHSNSQSCKVQALEDLGYDAQSLVDLRLPSEWTVQSFFGNGVHYSAVGEILERGIPCVLYHGIRHDWPLEEKKNITSLWEVSLAKNLNGEGLSITNNRVPFVSLNIYITKSPYNQSTGMYYEGWRATHHFHNVKALEPELMETTAFDISSCFQVENKWNIQFTIETDSMMTKHLSSYITDPNFLSAWRKVIMTNAGLRPSSLRVAKLRVSLISPRIEVFFTLLGRHPSLKVSEISLEDAANNIVRAVDNNHLKLDWKINREGDDSVLNLKVSKGSLKIVKISPPSRPYEYPTFSSGVMGAVGFVMLLLGVSAGSGIYFAKEKFTGTV